MFRYFLSASALLLASSHASAANCGAVPIAGELYSLVNVGTGLALDVTGGSTAPGAPLQQWGHAGSANQQFYLRDVGSGFWSLQAKHSNMMVDVQGASVAEGASVVQGAAGNGRSQRWLLRRSATGAYNLVASHSAKSLSVAGTASGAKISQALDTASGNQRWFFNPVSGACGAKPIGFANTPGTDGLATTTGGGSAVPVTVTSCPALIAALKSTVPAVVQIPSNATIDCRTPARTQMVCPVACASYQDPGKFTYRVPVGTQTCSSLGATSDALFARTRNDIRVAVASNKTLIGLDNGARLLGATLELNGVKNVIIRNLSVEEINPGLVEAGDGITVNNSTHVWIDHVNFAKISDGYLDMQNSRNVTVSWNRFNGVNPAVCGGQHHYTSLVQNSQVTLHHNFFDRTSGRNPKLSGSSTRAHLFNNYWLNNTYFAIAAGEGAQAKIEGNYFNNSARPHWNGGTGLLDASLRSNRYMGISATDPERDTGQLVFGDLILYPYTVDRVDDLPLVLGKTSGAP